MLKDIKLMNIKHFIKSCKNKVCRWYYRNDCQKYAETFGVKFGKGCWVASKDFPYEGYLIEIGSYVRIAAHASFYTHGAVVPLRVLYNDPNLDQFGKVKIGDFTSIGAYAMVMPGVTIGSRCIVAGGAVVTKSVPDGWMVAGNPAKFIGYTEDFYKKVKESYDVGTKNMSEEEKREYLFTLPEERFIKKGYLKQ